MGGSNATPLRLLIVEDSEDDALLVVRELRRGGYDPHMTRVDCAAEMQSALATQEWDLIVADHNLPGFDSSEALVLARRRDPNTPFILVSGSIGEEIAVDAMKSGAHDYVMKDNLARLLPAIERELREAENRRAHQQAEATIRHMAFHDGLTGLCNRSAFEQLLEEAVVSAQPEGHALLYLDLDQFKLVNDSCGHLTGDELLRRLAKRLLGKIRETDSLARLGGDEFGILLKHCPAARAEHIAQELLDTLKGHPFIWGERSFNIGASIGLVQIDGHQPPQELLRLADMACYAAKGRGRNRVHVYREGDEELNLRQGEMQWLQRLQEAMAGQGLLLYRQRIQPLQGGDPHQELLLRLRDESGQIITPDLFIPAAERYDLMAEIDRWVIQHACARLAQAGHADPIAGGTNFINLSATSLSDEGLAGYIQQQLAGYDLPPGRVGFEITETAAIADFDCALRLIKALRGLGCPIALDDFGTGMSSFTYLKSLSVDFVKIDGSFVRDMLVDEMDCAIVEAINRIGHIAGIHTIAEYVETEALLQRLTRMGVDYAQGWAVHRPSRFSDGQSVGTA